MYSRLKTIKSEQEESTHCLVTYIASNRYLSAPHQVEMTAFMDRSTDEILQMDKLSPQEMLELSKLITRKSGHDKMFHDWELEADIKVKVLENKLMDTVIIMTTSGAIGTQSREIIQKQHKSLQQAKASRRQQQATRVQNWTERTDLCDKFRQELLSMRINALPKQGEPLKGQPKRSFWSRGMQNRYAVEELDQ